VTDPKDVRVAWGMPANRMAAGVDDGQVPKLSYRGGMRYGGFNATWPFARLDLFSSGLRLRSNIKHFQRLIPIWEARFEELKEVQAIGRTKYLSTGVRFRTKQQGEWIVFWTFRRIRGLEGLEERDVSVSADPVRLHFWNAGR
jgi:hypothetical protein